MATEAERLAISTALAHVTAARDSLSKIDRATLDDFGRAVLYEAEGSTRTLWGWLEAKRKDYLAAKAQNGGVL